MVHAGGGWVDGGIQGREEEEGKRASVSSPRAREKQVSPSPGGSEPSLVWFDQHQGKNSMPFTYSIIKGFFCFFVGRSVEVVAMLVLKTKGGKGYILPVLLLKTF